MAFLSSLLRSRRLWGLAGTGVAMYLLFFVVLARVDMSWLMPDTTRLAKVAIEIWPRLPFFAVEKTPAPNGDTEVYYTVPTRQFTPQELARMGMTNHVAQPAQPK